MHLQAAHCVRWQVLPPHQKKPPSLRRIAEHYGLAVTSNNLFGLFIGNHVMHSCLPIAAACVPDNMSTSWHRKCQIHMLLMHSPHLAERSIKPGGTKQFVSILWVDEGCWLTGMGIVMQAAGCISRQMH